MRFHVAPVLRQLVLLGLVASAHLVAFVLVYWLTVRTVVGREFGDAALRGALLTQDAVSDTVDAVLDIVSVASLMGALAVVATIALLRLARVLGLAALGLMVAANGSTWLLKEHLLTRPDLGLDEFTPATLNSLPSGHTTAVVSALAAVLLVLPHRLRLVVAGVGGVFSFVTAMATMSAGWHRVGDSVAAALVVGFWTAAAAAAVVSLSESAHPPSEPPASGARWLGAATVGALALGVALALLLTSASGLRDGPVGQTLSLLAGACIVGAAVAGVLLGILRALEVMDTGSASVAGAGDA